MIGYQYTSRIRIILKTKQGQVNLPLKGSTGID
jgi:hypothetical protein